MTYRAGVLRRIYIFWVGECVFDRLVYASHLFSLSIKWLQLWYRANEIIIRIVWSDRFLLARQWVVSY